MRLGQKNGLVRQWAKKGTRPRQPKDQRYRSLYLFGAICPARGTGAALARGVPSGAIEQEDSVGAGCDVAGDLAQVSLHGIGVGPR